MRRGFNRIGLLINFNLVAKQPIVQLDGHSCGINTIDIFLGDDKGFFGGRPLTREMVSKHIHKHFGDHPISVDTSIFEAYGRALENDLDQWPILPNLSVNTQVDYVSNSMGKSN